MSSIPNLGLASIGGWGPRFLYNDRCVCFFLILSLYVMMPSDGGHENDGDRDVSVGDCSDYGDHGPSSRHKDCKDYTCEYMYGFLLLNGYWAVWVPVSNPPKSSMAWLWDESSMLGTP